VRVWSRPGEASVKAHSAALQGVTLRFTQGKLARLRAKAAMKTPDGGQRDESLRPPEVRGNQADRGDLAILTGFRGRRVRRFIVSVKFRPKKH
jgi:hypothetical protein